MGAAPTILMCPPDYYGIEYEINPWMSRARPADTERAAAQWRDLKNLLVSLGATIRLQEAAAGLPDLVFTANAALIHEKLAILSRFRHPQRQGETPLDESWLLADGFTTEHLPPELYFEGAGDALFCGQTLFAGYRTRSDARSHQWVGKRLGVRVIPLELVDGYYYHLDTCFCPLAEGLAAWYPGAFDRYGQQAMQEIMPELIEVDAEEARSFACNAVVVGRNVVTNTGCPKLHARLQERGFTPFETPLSEFVKSGGSAKCLTLRLDGEEAASWRKGE